MSTKFICEKCAKEYVKQAAYNTHINKCTGKKIKAEKSSPETEKIKCEKCNRKFKTEVTYKKHSCEPQFHCTCKKSFVSKTSYDKHVLSCGQIFTCGLEGCVKEFDTQKKCVNHRVKCVKN